jgi:lysozyme
MTATGSANRRRDLVLILSAGTIILVATVASVWLYQNGLLRLNYPSVTRFPIQGVDVSHHQASINWQEVAKTANIRFAFIKATEGGNYKDPFFAANWENSRKVGLARGAYHFFTFCRPGTEQARNYLETVPRDEDAMPVTLDLEFGGNCDRHPTKDELVREIQAFVVEVQKTDPRQPIFYATPEFFREYLESGADEFPATTYGSGMCFLSLRPSPAKAGRFGNSPTTAWSAAFSIPLT